MGQIAEPVFVVERREVLPPKFESPHGWRPIRVADDRIDARNYVKFLRKMQAKSKKPKYEYRVCPTRVTKL